MNAGGGVIGLLGGSGASCGRERIIERFLAGIGVLGAGLWLCLRRMGC